MRPRRNPISKRLGSALVMTLVIIVLITVVTVGYLASVMLETKTATSSLGPGESLRRRHGRRPSGDGHGSAMLSAPGTIPTSNFCYQRSAFLLVGFARADTRFNYSRFDLLELCALFRVERAGACEPEPAAWGRILSHHRRFERAGVSVKWVNLLAESHRSPPAPTTRSSGAMHSGSIPRAPRSTSIPRTAPRNTRPIRSASVRLPK